MKAKMIYLCTFLTVHKCELDFFLKKSHMMMFFFFAVKAA